MEDRIKILMTADTIGGVWTYAMSLCRALQKYNIEIHLMTMGDNPSEQQLDEVGTLKNLHLYSSAYKLEWMEAPWDDVREAGEWIRKVYNKVQPDILHFNNYGQVSGLWDCPVVTVFHSCVQTWWEAVKKDSLPQEWKKYRETVQKALLASDVLIAPTQSILNEAQKAYGKTGFSKVIYNGSNSRVYKSQKKEPFILTAGRIWDEAKNISLLSRIAKHLKWPVYVAGTDNYQFKSEEQEFQNIFFLGQLPPEELQQMMLKAALFVMPAKYEPFGLAVLEAARAGCTLALGNIGTLNEIWADTAMYFDPNKEEEVLKVLQQLIEDKELRDQLTKKSMKRAEIFTEEAMASNYFEVYKNLIAQRKVKTVINIETA
jgi:glycosyltransferase involved in cell wall biosynthesis